MAVENDLKIEGHDPLDEDRRKFLAACGKFAAITPPALTILLSTSLNSEAVAKSGGGSGGHEGRRHGGGDHDLLSWLEQILNKFF
jgi:hypothetical protein